jgi:hypothetical protein
MGPAVPDQYCLSWSIFMINSRFKPLASLPAPGAELAYLRGDSTSSHIHLKRLRACVSAKQNGFWLIIT